MSRPAPARCLICKRALPAPTAGQALFAPFCSERCKMVDLGRWLGGEYRIPGEDVASLDPSELSRLERDAFAPGVGERSDQEDDVDRDA